jgi:hypothetical protein
MKVKAVKKGTTPIFGGKPPVGWVGSLSKITTVSGASAVDRGIVDAPDEPGPDRPDLCTGTEIAFRAADGSVVSEDTAVARLGDGEPISPVKCEEAPSIAQYVTCIGESWRRGVAAMLEVCSLCADASKRLTPEQRKELLDRLPFGQSAFSKFVTIGKDKRLQAPEVKQLLSPHYSITYSLTQLREGELQQAIAANVVHPDMKRSDLTKWLETLRALRSPEEPADPVRVTAPRGAAESNGSSASAGDNVTPPPAPAESAPLPTLLDWSVNGESQALANTADEMDVGVHMDDRFERLKAGWAKYMKGDWDETPDETCDRFVADVLGYPERIA